MQQNDLKCPQSPRNLSKKITHVGGINVLFGRLSTVFLDESAFKGRYFSSKSLQGRWTVRHGISEIKAVPTPAPEIQMREVCRRDQKIKRASRSACTCTMNLVLIICFGLSPSPASISFVSNGSWLRECFENLWCWYLASTHTAKKAQK